MKCKVSSLFLQVSLQRVLNGKEDNLKVADEAGGTSASLVAKLAAYPGIKNFLDPWPAMDFDAIYYNCTVNSLVKTVCSAPCLPSTR